MLSPLSSFSSPSLQTHPTRGSSSLSPLCFSTWSHKMPIDQIPYDQTDDDYIDMDISSATFFCYSMSSPPQPSREFEFHMSSNPQEKEPTTSPADELFYKGKLLPLHLPPRLQMVQKLLQNTNDNIHESLEAESFEEYLTTTATTPFESCNISPSDSCQVSREINPDEYFSEYQPDDANFINQPKKSWSKKLKLIRNSSLGLKLKASRAYLKSLFSKSGCSDELCAAAARSGDECNVSKAKECMNKHMKVVKKNPFGQIRRERDPVAAAVSSNIGEEKVINKGSSHRRSFSGAIKRHSVSKSSLSSSSSSSNSSSSSFNSSSVGANSNRFYGLPLLKRSTSANSEVESPIQGAIAHCKQSQQLFCARKSVSDAGFCSLPVSRISSCEKRDWPETCSG